MNEKRKITLKDIAKELKLSPSTVSRALNGYPSLSEETIQLVKEYAAKHQYVPNTMAVNFRKNRTSILGMIVPQIVHHFFSTTISGALEAAKKRGYSILLAQSYDHLKDEVLASQYLLGMGVDGLLISVSNETKEAEHLQAFLDEGKAVVQFDKITELLASPKLVVDDFEGAYEATSHLIRQGYRKIAHLSGRMEVKNAEQRFLGYKKALEDHGLGFQEEWVKPCFDITEEDAKRQIVVVAQDRIRLRQARHQVREQPAPQADRGRLGCGDDGIVAPQPGGLQAGAEPCQAALAARVHLSTQKGRRAVSLRPQMLGGGPRPVEMRQADG